MKSRKHPKRLNLSTETLHRLTDETLARVDGGAPSKGPNCDFSEPSLCPTCLCTV